MKQIERTFVHYQKPPINQYRVISFDAAGKLIRDAEFVTPDYNEAMDVAKHLVGDHLSDVEDFIAGFDRRTGL